MATWNAVIPSAHTDQLPHLRFRVRTEHWKSFSMTFQDHLCPFNMSFQDFNRVDIEQVRSLYNTEYVTQFIIILNNRSNRVWQWTMITYVKAKNVHGSEMQQPFSLFSMTFQDLGLENLNFKFHDFSGSVRILKTVKFCWSWVWLM